MKNKEEIAVKITDKNREKVRGILEMFNQWYECGALDYKYIASDGLFWCGYYKNEKELVKPKELRNILAKEHLKEGDFIIGRNGYYDFVGKFKYHDFQGFKVSNWRCLGNDEFFLNESNLGGCFDNFLRYATEEEKALLEPKKELVVGMWYLLKGGSIVNYQGGGNGYGIEGGLNEWLDNSYWYFIDYEREATPKEVEEALIKEAKRRGYKKGCYIKSFVYGTTPIEYSEIHYRLDSNTLVMGGAWIFKDGKWAEIVNTKPNVINMYRLVKGNKCVRQFDEKQKDSLINNGWKEVTQQEVIDLLFKK